MSAQRINRIVGGIVKSSSISRGFILHDSSFQNGMCEWLHVYDLAIVDQIVLGCA